MVAEMCQQAAQVLEVEQQEVVVVCILEGDGEHAFLHVVAGPAGGRGAAAPFP
jgi:hypothetical protein